MIHLSTTMDLNGWLTPSDKPPRLDGGPNSCYQTEECIVVIILHSTLLVANGLRISEKLWTQGHQRKEDIADRENKADKHTWPWEPSLGMLQTSSCSSGQIGLSITFSDLLSDSAGIESSCRPICSGCNVGNACVVIVGCFMQILGDSWRLVIPELGQDVLLDVDILYPQYQMLIYKIASKIGTPWFNPLQVHFVQEYDLPTLYLQL